MGQPFEPAYTCEICRAKTPVAYTPWKRESFYVACGAITNEGNNWALFDDWCEIMLAQGYKRATLCAPCWDNLFTADKN